MFKSTRPKDKTVAGSSKKAATRSPDLQSLAREATWSLKQPTGELSKKARKILHSLLPRDVALAPLKAGEPGGEVVVDRRSAIKMLRQAAQTDKSGEVLWGDGDNDLLVYTSKLGLKLDAGFITVLIPVACDQVPDAIVEVTFAVGEKVNPAGLIVATETRPRGPAVVVDVWGHALTALAWHGLLRTITVLAHESGIDEDGAGLIPVAILAEPDQLHVQTMARHSFDRVPP